MGRHIPRERNATLQGVYTGSIADRAGGICR
jgi:hypothetical protein